MRCDRVVIAESSIVAPEIYALRVPFEGEVKAGQFFMLKPCRTPVLLPRAISVCDYDGYNITFMVQRVGDGTEALCNMCKGDELDMTGPLGNGFPIDKLTGKRVALVGGGIGIAPLLFTARKLKEEEILADAFLGYRSDTFLADDFKGYCKNISIATEDGSAGYKGYVTGVLSPADYDVVLCCGPEPMMRAVTGLCEQSGTDIYISMENKMACGVGGCLVCTCTDRQGHNLRACVEGPVFLGSEVDFDA